MLGSTSRPLAQATSVLQVASSSFSTSVRVSARKRKILVELLEDFPRVGLKFDRKFVQPGYARNDLVPRRIARIVPWQKWASLEQRQFPRRTDDYGVHPSALDPSFQIPAPTGLPPQGRSSLLPETTPQPLLNALHSLPDTLTFPLRTISATSSVVHGSLTLNDVVRRIGREHGLRKRDVEVSWGDAGMGSGDRVKELGEKEVRVKVKGGGGEEVGVRIEVVRLVEEGKGTAEGEVEKQGMDAQA